MKAGTTLEMPKPGSTQIPHIWIVITDPNKDGECVIVNVTSYKAICDNTVVLKKGDHPYIHHDSIIEYFDARITTSEKLKAAVNGGAAIPKQDCPPQTLKKIQEGALKSPHAAPKIKKFCSEAWKKKQTPSAQS